MNDLSSSNYVFSYAGNNGDGVKVIIGKNVTKIPAYLFNSCSYITSVEFEEGSVCESIGSAAFRDCTGLTSITIPDSVTSIGSGAFRNCTGLTSVTIGSGVTGIGNYAFYNCTGLTSITIPGSVTSIGKYAFDYCTGLEEIYFNATAMNELSSNNYVFSNAGKYGDGIKVVIGKNVAKIPAYLFEGCYYITSVEFEEGSVCESIGSWAFFCAGLTSITIPNSVTSIGSNAFYNCCHLAEVINKSSLAITAGSTYNGYIGYYALEVHSGESKIDSVGSYLFYIYDGVNYLLGYVGDDKDLILPNNYKGENYSIYDYAFYERSDLTSVTIPNSVKSIGDYAFYECTGLTSVTIPSSVRSIGALAFYRCTSLIEIDGGVSYVDKWVIDCDSSVTNVVLRSDLVGIADYAFSGCTGLTSVTIPESVTSIGSDAFSYCTGLTSVTIPDSVTSIGSYAFSGCTGLTSVTFANPNGWWRASSSTATSGTSISATDLSNASTAARYLKDTYDNYYWKK